MSSDSSTDTSQASTASDTLSSLIAGLHSLANATRSDITYQVNRTFGRAQGDSHDPNDPLDLSNWNSEADGSNPNEADDSSTDTMPSLHRQYPDNPNEADDSSTDTMPGLIRGRLPILINHEEASTTWRIVDPGNGTPMEFTFIERHPKGRAGRD
jgi:hypothetical protein